MIIAPEPKTGTCTTKPLETRGCRVLAFHYASATNAGAAPSEWGEYAGRLTSISFTAWNPAVNAMLAPTTVAQYAYDNLGRLRAEWDPRVTPKPDKTVYGYNAQNLLTALTPPGQQPYILQYGMPPAGGREPNWLISVTRPGPEKAFGNDLAPTNTAAPTLSTTSPTVGIQLSVAGKGSWSNAPLAYSYQWERCTSAGCAPIGGATNATYTPITADTGAELIARVVAYSAGGATSASSAESARVAQGTATEPTPPSPPNVGESSVETIEYGVPVTGSKAPMNLTANEVARWGQSVTEAPVTATAIFPPDAPQGWPAKDYKRAVVSYYDSAGRLVNTLSPGERLATTEYDPSANVIRTLTSGNRARALAAGTESATVSRQLDSQIIYNEAETQVKRRLGPRHSVKLAGGSVNESRSFMEYTYTNGSLVSSSREGALTELGSEADVRTIEYSYAGQAGLGVQIHKATTVTVKPASKAEGPTETRTVIYDKTTGNVVESTPPGGEERGAPVFQAQFGKQGGAAGKMNGPTGIAIDSAGNAWVLDGANNRIDEYSPSGTFIKAIGWGVSDGKAEFETCSSTCRSGAAGAGAGQLDAPEGVTFDAANGNLYVTDSATDRVAEFTTSGTFIQAFGWGVADGKAQLQSCTTSCLVGISGAGQGQLSGPRGLTADGTGALWVADSGNNRLVSFSAEGAFAASYGKAGTQKGEFAGVGDVTFCSTFLWATDTGNNRVQRLTTAGAFKQIIGGPGQESGQFKHVGRIACDAATKEIYVGDEGANRVDIFTNKGVFVNAFGSSGTLPGAMLKPIGLAVSSSGESYVVDDENSRIETWLEPNVGTSTTQTIYYTLVKNAKYPECGLHAEWQGMPCREQPKEEPGDALPPLGNSLTTYNVWDEPTTESRTVPGHTRTATTEYDAAGRRTKIGISSDVGQPVPAVSFGYDADTGGLETRHSSAGTITSVFNSVGQLAHYTDASGNTSGWIYDVDGRPTKIEDGKGTTTLKYNPTTGQADSLSDSAAGTFTAEYDAEGQLTSATYPNGMLATYAYNQVGERTALKYKKGASVWYEDPFSQRSTGSGPPRPRHLVRTPTATTSWAGWSKLRKLQPARVAQQADTPMAKAHNA